MACGGVSHVIQKTLTWLKYFKHVHTLGGTMLLGRSSTSMLTMQVAVSMLGPAAGNFPCPPNYCLGEMGTWFIEVINAAERQDWTPPSAYRVLDTVNHLRSLRLYVHCAIGLYLSVSHTCTHTLIPVNLFGFCGLSASLMIWIHFYCCPRNGHLYTKDTNCNPSAGIAFMAENIF